MAIENLKFTEDQKKFVTDEISRLKGLENRPLAKVVIASSSGLPVQRLS